MRNPFAKSGGTNRDSSFLPEDYLTRKNEVRVNTLSVMLFVTLSVALVMAFLVTGRQWNDVKQHQQAINIQYTQAAADIEQLKLLEDQRADQMVKADVTMALLERVQRSVLFAELINRMPSRMSLLSLELKSTRLDKTIKVRKSPAKASKSTSSSAPGKSLAKKSRTAKSSAKSDGKDAEKPAPEVKAPSFDTRVVLIGVAPTHQDVAQYVSGLGNCPLLVSVELMYSEKTTINDADFNKFRIEATLRQDVNTSEITPLTKPRLDRFINPPELGASKEGN